MNIITTITASAAGLLFLFGIFLYFYLEVFNKKMRNIIPFKWIVHFLEWAKIMYKPTQFYYTNKIQSRHKNTKYAGAGRVHVFCNKIKEIYNLQEELKLSDEHLIEINGYLSLAVLGSKIGIVKSKSTIAMSLPTAEIVKLLNKQRSDKVR